MSTTIIKTIKGGPYHVAVMQDGSVSGISLKGPYVRARDYMKPC